MTTSTSKLAAVTAALRDVVPGERILVSGPGYDAGRAVWNGAVTARPGVILRCLNAAEVRAGVLAARTAGVPLSVRGGGHDWAGRALADGGVTLDLSGMRSVLVDPEKRVATVAGGATAADVAGAADEHGLVAVTGTVGAVGMAGLTLGGGYGPLSGRFGLAVDSLLSADVVLADGSIVTTDAEHEPELFWALRGGGGNFGVVTAIRLRLHRIPALLSGMICYPPAQAAEVLTRLADHLPDGPDELTVQTGFVAAPDGSPMLFIAPTWCGEAEAGARHMDSLTRLGDPLSAESTATTLPAVLAGMDAMFPFGRHVETRTRTVAGLAPAVRAALVAGGTALPSPYSAVSVHSLHGAATRIPVANTAFGNRAAHLMVELIAVWQPGDATAPKHRAWARDVSANLAPHAVPGGYPNMLGPDDSEQIQHAYGPNTTRLLAAKSRYDPEAAFRAIPLPELA